MRSPLLRGAATPSEAMRLLERGYNEQKFFPAEANGGAKALKAIGAPIPQVRFCPTGGVSLANVAEYLSLANTLWMGGSRVAPRRAGQGPRLGRDHRTGRRGGGPAALTQCLA